MLFSSLTFLFLYLPLVLAIYHLIPLRARNLFLLLAAAAASLPLMKHLKEKLEKLAACRGSLETVWNVVVYSVIPVVLLLLSTACLVGNSYNPFIYFRF